VIPDLVPPVQRGRASGFFGMTNLLGTLAGAGIAGYFLDRALQTQYLFVAAGLLVGVAIITAVTVREQAEYQRPDFAGVLGELVRRLQEVRARPGFAWLVLSRLFFFMGLLAADNTLLFFIREKLGLVEQAGLYTSAALAALISVAALTSLPAGWLSDTLGRRRLVFVSCAIGVAAAIWLLFTPNYPMLLVGFGLLGLAVGMFTASDWALAIDLLPDPRMPGLYMGLTNLATAGGDALASLSAGLVLDTFNRMQPLLGYSAVFTMMAGYFALSSLILLKLPQTAIPQLPGQRAPAV